MLRQFILSSGQTDILINIVVKGATTTYTRHLICPIKLWYQTYAS